MAKKAYVGIPETYTAIEYLQANANQYVDTGVTMKSTLKVEGEFYDVGVIGIWYGARNPNSSDVYQGLTTSGSSNKRRVTFSGLDSSDIALLDVSVDEWHTISHSRDLYIDNEFIKTFNNDTFTLSKTLYLFAINAESNHIYTNNYPVRMKWCKVYDNNVLVRDFVPCIKNNEVCIYDKLNNIYYHNIGTGDFTAGPTVQDVSVGIARKITKGYVGVPKTYSIVDYIESSGTQYIDTGVNVSQDISFEAELQNTNSTTSTHLFGSRVAFRNSAIGLSYQTESDVTGYAFAFGTEVGYSLQTSLAKQTFSISGNTAYIDDVSAYSFSSQTFSSNYPIYLFTTNNAGTPHTQYASMKLYGCRIYDNNVLVRDFVPVLDSNNVACLFDRVTNTAYYNAGTGTFTAGTTTSEQISIDVARKIKKGYVGVKETYSVVDYIQSNGTQYVITDYYANEKTRMEAKVVLTNISSGTQWQCLFSSKTGFRNNEYVMQVNKSSMGWYTAYGSSSGTQASDWPVVEGGTYIIDKNREITTINNVSASKPLDTFTSTQPSYIFCDYESGTINYFYGKLYYMKIYDNDVLIRDFVPVVDSNNVACLFDRVNNMPYYNLGAGTFTAGSATGETIEADLARQFFAST